MLAHLFIIIIIVTMCKEINLVRNISRRDMHNVMLLNLSNTHMHARNKNNSTWKGLDYDSKFSITNSVVPGTGETLPPILCIDYSNLRIQEDNKRCDITYVQEKENL